MRLGLASMAVCSVSLLLLSSRLAAHLMAAQGHDGPVGYSDTPFLPDGKWRVHDSARPVPPVVAPAAGANLGAAAPADAVVLFDGRDLAQWRQGTEVAKWQLEGGAMVVNGTGTIESARAFGDCQVHLEFASPAQVEGSSQGRGNSGLFFMGRYEVQILDSFQNRTYADGQAGALYGQQPPLVNASRGPGEWQSFDAVFRAPRFEGEKLLSPARLTLFHNGVLVQDATEFIGATRHREVATYAAHEAKLPLALQDHGNPLRFRNIWVREL